MIFTEESNTCCPISPCFWSSDSCWRSDFLKLPDFAINPKLPFVPAVPRQLLFEYIVVTIMANWSRMSRSARWWRRSSASSSAARSLSSSLRALRSGERWECRTSSGASTRCHCRLHCATMWRRRRRCSSTPTSTFLFPSARRQHRHRWWRRRRGHGD